MNPIGIEVKANRFGLGREADKLKATKKTHMEEGEIAELDAEKEKESKAEGDNEENDNNDAKENDDDVENDDTKQEEETPTVRKKQKARIV